MKTQKIMMLAGVSLLVYLAWMARPKSAASANSEQYVPAWSGSSDYGMNIEDRGLQWT